MRTLTLTHRMILIAVIPILGFMIYGFLELRTQNQASNAASKVMEQLVKVRSNFAFAAALSQERDHALAYIGSVGYYPVNHYLASVEATDAAANNIDAQAKVAKAELIRAGTASLDWQFNQSYSGYAQLIDNEFALFDSWPQAFPTTQLSQMMEGSLLMMRGESAARSGSY